MGEPLYLSMWLADFTPLALPLYFRKALEVFPFSKLSPAIVLRVYAISFLETPVFECFIDGAMEAREVAELAQEHLHDDCCYQLEASWDLLQWDREWTIQPSKVCIELYAPNFERDMDDQLRITLGDESLFLPHPVSDRLRPVQSNIRSILHLADDLEGALSVDRRLLWSAEDENFAERLALLLDDAVGE